MAVKGLEWDDLAKNAIFLDGYVCKPPVYRITPRGFAIADLLIAVNRSYGKADYIPCICWGYNAQFAASFDVGSHIKNWGRIQSREYLKKLNEIETEKRVAYEVSINKLVYADDKIVASYQCISSKKISGIKNAEIIPCTATKQNLYVK